MLVLSAYYDGDNVKTVEDYKFSKNQKLIITVLDDEESEKPTEIKALRGSLAKYSNPQLKKKEKDAWAMAVGEKHGLR